MNAVLKAQCQKRRQHLFDRMVPHSALLLPSAKSQFRNHDCEYPFRQEGNFYYVSGFNEDDALLALIKKDRNETVLFCPSSCETLTQWVGPRLGPQAAPDVLGVDEAFDRDQIDDKLLERLKGIQTLYVPMGQNTAFDQQVMTWLMKMKSQDKRSYEPALTLIHAPALIQHQRLIKDPFERTQIEKAIEVTCEGHLKAMAVCAPGKYEYMLEAELLHTFCQRGCRAQAYNAIVGAGDNGCILHYTDNQAQIKDGDLVLIDAGAEYNNYAADITRTFPANGKFSPAQAALYDIVLSAQKKGIEHVRPNVPWDRVQQAILEEMVQGLVDCKILTGDPKTLIEEKAYKPFYMHNSGHWLGLDVHDLGAYKDEQGQWIQFQPHMILTVEPGLYIWPNHKHVDEKWWGIGIRVEDDVLVTETGHHVLSSALPKERKEIEACVGKMQ